MSIPCTEDGGDPKGLTDSLGGVALPVIDLVIFSYSGKRLHIDKVR